MTVQRRVIATDGTVQQHNLARVNNQPDEDWVSFPVQSGAKYLVEATPLGADADIVLSLYSECGRPGTASASPRLQFTAAVTGVYYVRATGRREPYGPDNSFGLKVTEDTSCAGYAEPNNDCGMPVDISLDDSGSNPWISVKETTLTGLGSRFRREARIALR